MDCHKCGKKDIAKLDDTPGIVAEYTWYVCAKCGIIRRLKADVSDE